MLGKLVYPVLEQNGDHSVIVWVFAACTHACRVWNRERKGVGREGGMEGGGDGRRGGWKEGKEGGRAVKIKCCKFSMLHTQHTHKHTTHTSTQS